jgi:acyl carrier protein
MVPSELEAELKRFLVDQLFVEMPVEDIRADMLLGREVGVDSLGFTELMAHLEERYEIRITKEEFGPENFRDLNAIVALINRKKGLAA